jgi:mannonate dehydratase
MMKITFPWFGDEDSITIDHLNYLRGLRGVSVSLNSVPVGELVPTELVCDQKEKIWASGYAFEVLEDLPVHEDIKLRSGDFERYIENYKENIARFSMAGARVISYSFAAGQDEAFRELGRDGLWKNLELFVREIIPVALRMGVHLAFRFDGSSERDLGIERLIACEEDIDRFLSIHGDQHHGIAMSSAGIEASGFDSYLGMIGKYGAMGRIHYALLRDVKVRDDGSFQETAHCSPYDSRDMVRIMTAYHEAGYDGCARFDHSRMTPACGPSFDLYDRTVGTMYITGILLTLDSRIKAMPKKKIA